MLKAEQIPETARQAAHSAALKADFTVEEIVVAAINAWPGMQVRLNYFQPTEEIILPLLKQEGE